MGCCMNEFRLILNKNVMMSNEVVYNRWRSDLEVFTSQTWYEDAETREV